MKKILVIGNSGSGKTTFAKTLAEKTNFPLIHLDKLFWCGNWEHVTREEFDNFLQIELEKEKWIIDGDFSRTMNHRFQYADTVFYLDFSTFACLWGATVRVFKSFGKTRDDMGGNCPEYFDKQKISLYKSIIFYNKVRRKECYHLISQFTNKNIIIFKNRRQVKKYIKNL